MRRVLLNRLNVPVLLVAAGVVLAPARAAAIVTYSVAAYVDTAIYAGKVFGTIKYTLFCADGSIVPGQSTVAPGEAECADGSQRVEWTWGHTPTEEDPLRVSTIVVVTSNKDAPISLSCADTLTVRPGNPSIIAGRAFGIQGGFRHLERAVLRTNGPTFQMSGPMSVASLLGFGMVDSADVLAHRSWNHVGASIVRTTDSIPEAPVLYSNQYVLFSHGRSEDGPGAPGANAIVTVLLLMSLLGAGAFRARSRARGDRSAPPG